MNPRERRSTTGVMLLLFHVLNNVSERGIPPVTLLTIGAQVLIYLRLIPIPWNVHSACLSAQKVLYYGDYWPILFSVVEHADDIHLYFNMASFLLKGQMLERRLGSKKFASLLVVFMLACSGMYVALATAGSELLDDPQYFHQCAVGFSGVIFALKVLTTAGSSSMAMVGPGIMVPMKWVVWLELVLIQIMSPNASFIGHLAGIIVGVLYTHGPLKFIVDVVDGIIPGISNNPSAPNPRRFDSRGYSSSTMTEEEQVAEAIRRSQQDQGSWGSWRPFNTRSPPYQGGFPYGDRR